MRTRLAFLACLILSFSAVAQDALPPLVPPPTQPGTIGQQIAAVILPILSMVLMGLATAAVAAAKRWMDAKATESKVAAVGSKALDFTLLVVHDIEANLKPMIDEFAKDGRIDAEEGKRLRETAIARVKLMLGLKGVEELQKVLGLSGDGLEHYLGGLVETAVAKVVPPKTPAMLDVGLISGSLTPPAVAPVVP